MTAFAVFGAILAIGIAALIIDIGRTERAAFIRIMIGFWLFVIGMGGAAISGATVIVMLTLGIPIG